MRLEQLDWTAGPSDVVLADADLVLVFAGSNVLATRDLFAECRARFSRAHVVGCSTAGEILGTYVHSDSVACTAIRFERSRASLAVVPLPDAAASHAAGRELAERLDPNELVHVWVICDGIGVNGTELARGLTEGLPRGVTVSGGLAGDGARMTRTAVIADAPAQPRVAAAVGLYGSRLRVGYGCRGGWDPFGPERLVTRADGNELYELDHGSALELYERYLGAQAAGLPATGLLFPLSVRAPGGTQSVVRTILGVDRDRQSIRFAGDVPVGHYARLMKANLDRLVDGAHGAAELARRISDFTPELAILVSCVGRRLVLGQRVEEEIESARDALGGCAMTGFYSNGEISPSGTIGCELHNQTMTITTLSEVA